MIPMILILLSITVDTKTTRRRIPVSFFVILRTNEGITMTPMILLSLLNNAGTKTATRRVLAYFFVNSSTNEGTTMIPMILILPIPMTLILPSVQKQQKGGFWHTF